MRLSLMLSIIVCALSCNGRREQNATASPNTVSATPMASNANSPNGVYKSSDDSYRKNFYLQIVDDSATLYGWEPGYPLKDSIFYKAKAKFEIDGNDRFRLAFVDYAVSYLSVSHNKIEEFVEDKTIETENIFFYNSFTGSISNGKLKVIATKNIYDSNADPFEFISIKHVN